MKHDINALLYRMDGGIAWQERINNTDHPLLAGMGFNREYQAMNYTPPAKLRSFFCTKCGCRECVQGTAMQKHPPCANCGYLGFASDLDYTESQLRSEVERIRRETVEECAKVCEKLYREQRRYFDGMGSAGCPEFGPRDCADAIRSLK